MTISHSMLPTWSLHTHYTLCSLEKKYRLNFYTAHKNPCMTKNAVVTKMTYRRPKVINRTCESGNYLMVMPDAHCSNFNFARKIFIFQNSKNNLKFFYQNIKLYVSIYLEIQHTNRGNQPPKAPVSLFYVYLTLSSSTWSLSIMIYELHVVPSSHFICVSKHIHINDVSSLVKCIS